MSLVLTILVFALFIALRVVTARRLADRVLNKDERIQWFGFNRTLDQMSLAFWIIWLALLCWLNPFGEWLLMRTLSHWNDPSIILLLAFGVNCFATIVPALVGFWCDLIVYPAVQELRNLGITRREYRIDAAFVRLWIPVAVALFWTGFSAIRWSSYGTFAIPAGSLWLIGSPWIWRKLRGSAIYEPHSLTHGPLRDRAFEMAAKAGVELKQIYVYPLEKWKLANAWASEQNTLLLTDTLLRQLNRREVDAIVAHELAHMKRGHASKQSWLLTLVVIIPIMIFHFYYVRHGRLSEFPRLESFALFMIGLWQVFKFGRGWLSRRHEVQADAAGLALSNDGAAFISGLAKLHRMNATPLEFKRLEEGFSTHPSTQRRFDAVAKASNISVEELKKLIADGLDESERYPLPVGITPEPGEEALLFTSRVKQKSVGSFTTAYVVSLSVPPAIWMVSSQFMPEGARRWILFAAFVAFYAWFIVTMLDRAGHGVTWQLRERLRKKVMPGADTPWFVGLSPHRDLRVYEGAYVWDLGYLEIAPGEIRYAGEQTSIVVQAQDVRAIKLVSGAPRWRKTKVILIEWIDPETNHSSAFRLSCPGPSFSHGAKAAEKLYQQLVAWRESSQSAEFTKGSRKPILPEVTSKPPDTGTRKDLLATLLLACCIPIGIALGLGSERKTENLLSGAALAIAGGVFALIPFWRKPRIFAQKEWSARETSPR